MPRLCELYPGVCLTAEDKARKNLSEGLSVDVIDREIADWGENIVSCFITCFQISLFPVRISYSIFFSISLASSFYFFKPVLLTNKTLLKRPSNSLWFSFECNFII